MKRYTICHKPDQFSQEIADKIKSLLNEFMLEDEQNPELVISVGGDGTMLYSVHKYLDSLDQVCFIGIHTGTLGFLTDYEKDDVLDFVNDLQHVEPRFYYRDLLDITTDTGKQFYALNELRIEDSRRTLVFDICIDDDIFEHFRGTGLCISTSSGSTGYNKSLGGAVVKSSTPLMQITEIAGISSNAYRSLASPFVIDGKHSITLKSANLSKAVLGYDHLYDIFKDEKSVHIKIANKKARFVTYKKTSFFSRLKRSFL